MQKLGGNSQRHNPNDYKEVLNKMIQMATEQMKSISDRQMEAIQQIVQSKEFTLGEYEKLKEVLGRRVITRRDASAFLEYCYARVHFERYFNGHRHRAYAGCRFCRSRDDLRRVASLETGKRAWCCEACISRGADPNLVVVPRRWGGIGGTRKRREVLRIRGLATDILSMADDSSAGVVPRQVAERAEEIREKANGLLRGKAEAEQTQEAAAAAVVVPQLAAGQVGGGEGVKDGY